METQEIIAGQPANLYEIGYLLNPLIPAEGVSAEADKALRTPIEALGGEVTSQLMPFMRPLAYAVSKSIGSKRSSYKDAYFGALRFELTSDKIADLKDALDKSEMILRFLLIRLPKNAERVINFTYRKPASRHEGSADRPVAKEAEAIEKVEINEEQIDKEIEDLLVTAE
ncbi:MAG: 30S ribosomal protein S6 [Candidatus Paceibacterota bacterium]|jgi:ribosomal protein S6